MIDFNQFPMNKKPYSDGTLKCMTKENLIEYIRDIEHNYAALYTLYKNAVDANLEKFKDFEKVIRCKDCVYFTSEKSGEHWNVCRFYDAPKTADGFCNDAEPKEME